MTKASTRSGATFDDPNREALGLAPIWTGAGETPPPPEGDPPSAPQPKSKGKAPAELDPAPAEEPTGD